MRFANAAPHTCYAHTPHFRALVLRTPATHPLFSDMLLGSLLVQTHALGRVARAHILDLPTLHFLSPPYNAPLARACTTPSPTLPSSFITPACYTGLHSRIFPCRLHFLLAYTRITPASGIRAPGLYLLQHNAHTLTAGTSFPLWVLVTLGLLDLPYSLARRALARSLWLRYFLGGIWLDLHNDNAFSYSRLAAYTVHLRLRARRRLRTARVCARMRHSRTLAPVTGRS